MLFTTSICSFLVLALYKLIKMYSEPLIETSRIKMRPSLSVSCLLTKKVSVFFRHFFLFFVFHYRICVLSFSFPQQNINQSETMNWWSLIVGGTVCKGAPKINLFYRQEISLSKAVKTKV